MWLQKHFEKQNPERKDNGDLSKAGKKKFNKLNRPNGDISHAFQIGLFIVYSLQLGNIL